jgi:hypothetical protein
VSEKLKDKLSFKTRVQAIRKSKYLKSIRFDSQGAIGFLYQSSFSVRIENGGTRKNVRSGNT